VSYGLSAILLIGFTGSCIACACRRPEDDGEYPDSDEEEKEAAFKASAPR